MEGEIERTVRVWNREYPISVYRTSKTVWVAKGEYMGRNIEVKGRSASAAIGRRKDWPVIGRTEFERRMTRNA
jgi:hypothetical protein